MDGSNTRHFMIFIQFGFDVPSCDPGSWDGLSFTLRAYACMCPKVRKNGCVFFMARKRVQIEFRVRDRVSKIPVPMSTHALVAVGKRVDFIDSGIPAWSVWVGQQERARSAGNTVQARTRTLGSNQLSISHQSQCFQTSTYRVFRNITPSPVVIEKHSALNSVQ